MYLLSLNTLTSGRTFCRPLLLSVGIILLILNCPLMCSPSMLVDKNGKGQSQYVMELLRILKFMIGYKLYFNFPKGRKAQNVKNTGHPLIFIFKIEMPPANDKEAHC